MNMQPLEPLAGEMLKSAPGKCPFSLMRFILLPDTRLPSPAPALRGSTWCQSGFKEEMGLLPQGRGIGHPRNDAGCSGRCPVPTTGTGEHSCVGNPCLFRVCSIASQEKRAEKLPCAEESSWKAAKQTDKLDINSYRGVPRSPGLEPSQMFSRPCCLNFCPRRLEAGKYDTSF